jgi:hypothetical protein
MAEKKTLEEQKRFYLEGMPLRPFTSNERLQVKVVMNILMREGSEFNRKQPLYKQVNEITNNMTEDEKKALYGEANWLIAHHPPFMR